MTPALSDDVELREDAVASAWALAGLACESIRPGDSETNQRSLEMALIIAQSGEPLFPLGCLSDMRCLLGLVSLDDPRGPRTFEPPIASTLLRRHRDLLWQRWQNDRRCETAALAIARYSPTDQSRAAAFFASRMRDVLNWPAVHLSPGLLRRLLALSDRERSRERELACQHEPVRALLSRQYERMARAIRHAPQVVLPADLFELEIGVAAKPFSERLALRQTFDAIERLAPGLPAAPPARSSNRGDIRTAAVEEDLFPVGGYSSLAHRGSIESLLHSQLAFMEPDERPDLFDLKYLRDELLYFARDENQSSMPRTTIFVLLSPELVRCRVKQDSLPYQSIILVVAAIVAAARAWTRWHSHEELRIEFCCPQDGHESPLKPEARLLRWLLAPECGRQLVHFRDGTPREAAEWRESASRRRRCFGVQVTTSDEKERNAPAGFVSMTVPDAGATSADSAPADRVGTENVDPMESWRQWLRQLASSAW